MGLCIWMFSGDCIVDFTGYFSLIQKVKYMFP